MSNGYAYESWPVKGSKRLLKFIILFLYLGPYFVIQSSKAEFYKSEVFDKVKKGDSVLLMRLDSEQLSSPIVFADVMIEFFNKPKRMKKVITYML